MNIVVIILIIKYLLNCKWMVPATFLNEKFGRIFLYSLAIFPNQLISRHHQFARALWLVSSLFFSPASSAVSVGLAREQTEKSKEKRPGKQRGDYSQRTEQKQFGYGLCCHWRKQGKVSKRGTLASVIISDCKPQR